MMIACGSDRARVTTRATRPAVIPGLSPGAGSRVDRAGRGGRAPGGGGAPGGSRVGRGDRLGDEADGDLGDRLRADVEPDRGRDPRQVGFGNPLLTEAVEDEPDLASAADQAHVGGPR